MSTRPTPRLADIPVQPAATIEPLLRRDDLPRLLGCSVETIDRMRAAGKLPKPDLIVGRRSPRWRPETIRAWIEAGGAR